ncbi:MAG: Ig-like domain-containing protein [Flavobacteriaceae bacterium]|nr:Ig-like domain-containing protein [Flavobacteriaceae bacterium]
MKYFYTFLIITLLISCAKQGRPTGGEKDETPPVLLMSKPVNESVNFKIQKIKIYFDEYVKFNKVNEQLVVSPPLKYPAKLSPLGYPSKYITIELKDTLHENTTYNFNFGNSIVDNNESNPFKNFKYIFSTGDYIDSLTVEGNIKDALMMDMQKNTTVMLYPYEGFYDSIVYKEKPRYIANTLDSTYFKITNIRAGKYFMVTIKEKTNDYLFAPKSDKIGFLKNEITIPADTIYNIKIFKEVLDFKMLRPTESVQGKIIFPYEGKPEGLDIRLLTKVPDSIKYSFIPEVDKDSLNFWFTHSKDIDSLLFIASKDDYIDTLTVRLRTTLKDSMVIKKSHSGSIPMFKRFKIHTNRPISYIDTAFISLVKDSIPVSYKASVSENKDFVYLDFEKEYDSKYKFELLPGAITDFYESTNDTLACGLNVLAETKLGIIRLKLSSEDKYPVIVELRDSKNITIIEKWIEENKTIEYKDLTPGDYTIKITIDSNRNKIWDTGNFLRKEQPEKIFIFPKTISVRENWDLEESFDLDTAKEELLVKPKSEGNKKGESKTSGQRGRR